MSDETKDSEDVKAPAKKSSKAKKATKPKAQPIRRARVFRFEQWATRRGVAQHHKGGMRAYVKNAHKPRTLEAWDACFQDY